MPGPGERSTHNTSGIVVGNPVAGDDFFGREPRIMLLASSVSLFEEIESPNAALYEQFLVYPLEPLDTEGFQSLWHAVTGQLLSKRRMRPDEILTGGNPRLLVILSTFASKSSLRGPMEDLVGLIDDQTDYLKSSTEALPGAGSMRAPRSSAVTCQLPAIIPALQ